MSLCEHDIKTCGIRYDTFPVMFYILVSAVGSVGVLRTDFSKNLERK